MRDRSNKSGRAAEAGEKPAWPAEASVFVVAEEKHQDSPEQAAEAETRLQDVWRVVVLNDPVNLMSYVVMVFKKIFGYDESRARRHMLEVHEKGRSVVWTGVREQAEAYVFTLQQWHLTAVLESDESA
jgi:ATP-dependent Clp protease adaptor protein ClpS